MGIFWKGGVVLRFLEWEKRSLAVREWERVREKGSWECHAAWIQIAGGFQAQLEDEVEKANSKLQEVATEAKDSARHTTVARAEAEGLRRQLEVRGGFHL